jgi:hypothetical protein
MTTTKGCDEFNLDAILLKSGGHGDEFSGECCMVEAANRAALCIPELRTKFGAPEDFEADHPSISPVIRGFCINWNDSIRDDETRTRLLKPYVTRILGTKPQRPTNSPAVGWLLTGSLAPTLLLGFVSRV